MTIDHQGQPRSRPSTSGPLSRRACCWRRQPASISSNSAGPGETGRRDGGDWKLYLIHTYAVLKDPPSIALPQKELEQYVGTYSAAPDLTYIIRWDGQRLVGGKKGSSMKPLEVEVRDVLFVPGQPRIRKIFQRDAKGKITGFVDRRESWDLVWKKEGK